MVFTLYVAADMYGKKVNLELEFPSFPSLAEVNQAVQMNFANEAVALRPTGTPAQTFGIQKLQVYKESDGSWDDLVSPSQLAEYAQLYVFQTDPSLADNQSQILAPRKPTRPAPVSPSSMRSPPRTTSNTSVAAAPSPAPSATPLSQSRPSPAPVTQRRSTSPQRSPAASTTSYTPRPVAPPVTGPSPAALAAASASARQHAASQTDKIRYVFDEMDANGNRMIEPEEFRNLLRALNIDFSTATVTDLFRKADNDGDGVISVGEFAHFFSLYTTLLDSLYYRLRDASEGRQLQRDLADEQSQLDAARERRERALQLVSDAQRAVESQQAKLRDLEAERQARLAREAEAQSLHTTSADELNAAHHSRAAAAGDVDSCRAREDAQKGVVIASQNDVSDLERRLASEQNQLSAAHDKERQLAALLAEAQRESERIHKNVYESQIEVSRAREREALAADALAAAAAENARAQEMLAACERDVIGKTDRNRELARLVDEIQADVARLMQTLDDEKRSLHSFIDRERDNRAAANEAEITLQAQDRRTVAKDQEIVQFTQRRAAMEQQERPLLEQEVRLREQRDSLDEKEVQLRHQSGNHFDVSRVALASPSRNNAGSPSSAHASTSRYATSSSPYNTNSYRTISPTRRR